MIKWFCDKCKLEIVAPERIVNIHAWRAGKARDEADIGWGESDDILKGFYHEACADQIEAAITRVAEGL